MKSKILVINDDREALDLFSFILDQSGYEVLTADNGESGLEIALKAVPDLIISDVKMPGKDGFEICKLLREDLRLKATPILLVTAAVKDAESAVRGLEAGNDDYLEIPLEPTRLAAKVARWIERKRMETELKESEAVPKPFSTT